MRRDIKKVIFERAKGNRSWASKTPRANRVVLDTSDGQLNEASNYTRLKRQKHRNVHFNAIERFLVRNVGRPWSKIYAELCSVVDARSLLGTDIRAHVESCVALKCWLDGKKVMTHDCLGRARPVRALYVHPTTGVLMRTRDDRRQR